MTDETPPTDVPVSLVYLDVDDEITSAAARIRAAEAERVALVLPYGSRLATSRINFRLLAREATERGKKVEIIGADASARALAASAGLSVHASVAAFEGRVPPPGSADATGTAATGDTAWTRAGGGFAAGVAGASDDGAEPIPAPDDDTQTRVLPIPRRSSPRVPMVGPPRPPLRTNVAIGAGVAVLALVLVGGLLGLELLPSATIVLHPRSEEIGPLELTVEARTDVAAPDATDLTIPAQQLTFELAASDTFPATGVRTVETKATGTVTFSNFDTGRGVVIPAGTIVQTEGKIQFKTLAEVTLPRAEVDFFPPFPVHPSTRAVEVEAVLAGPDGNVGNNTITDVVKGGRNLFVNNKDATTGGSHTESPEISEQDVEAAKAAIEAALVAELDRQLAAEAGVPAGITLFPETRTVGDSAYEADPGTLVGTLAPEFTLSATAQGTALGVDPAPLAGIAESRLRARITSGWTLVTASITPLVGTPTVVGDVVTYPVTIVGTQVHDVDEAALVKSIKGLVLAEARTRLNVFGDAEVSLWPDWVTSIPKREDRITLTLGNPQPSPSPEP